MLTEFLNRLLELQRPETVRIDDRDYWTSNGEMIRPPTSPTFQFHTLTALVNWIEINEVDEELFIVVSEPNQVVCCGLLNELHFQRNVYAASKTFEQKSFPFDRYMSIEEFIICAQARLIPTPARAKLIQAVSNIRGTDVVSSIDDGISQEVSVSNKIGRLENVKIEPLIKLAPYRTFSEIEQPESGFILRMRQVEKGLPQVALFTTGDTSWKNSAILSIRDWLKDQDVISRKEIDVIA